MGRRVQCSARPVPHTGSKVMAVSKSVMAVFDFHGDSEELASRYDDVLHEVVAMSSSRPVIHLAVPREYGFMVVDVWSSADALEGFESNEDLQRALREGDHMIPSSACTRGATSAGPSCLCRCTAEAPPTRTPGWIATHPVPRNPARPVAGRTATAGRRAPHEASPAMSSTRSQC
jgi:hypothetical protein